MKRWNEEVQDDQRGRKAISGSAIRCEGAQPVDLPYTSLEETMVIVSLATVKTT